MPCPLISFIKCSFLSYVSKQKIAVIQEAEAGDEIATYDDDPIGLLPDTEFTENIPENFIGGDFAGDFAQMMEAVRISIAIKSVGRSLSKPFFTASMASSVFFNS